MSNVSGRQESVLRVVEQTVGGLATQVPAPPIAEALGYVGALAGYAVRSAGRDQRRSEHGPALDRLCTSAEELLADELTAANGASADRATSAVVGLTRAAAEGVPGADGLLRELLAVLVTIEEGGSDGAANRSGQSAAATPPGALDPETLTSYLRARSGDDPVVVEDVKQIGGGFSKITTLLSYEAAGERHDIALRQVPPGLVDESLVPEYEVLRHVWSPELPIPEPLWIEPDQNELGGPFFASRQAHGGNLGTVFGATQDVPESVCLELAEFLAHLHNSDVRGLERTPVASMRTPDEIEQSIGDEERDAFGAAVGPQPVLAGMFAWLRAHAPNGAERVTVVHGDVGFHNLLVEDGHLTAILDWERAHLGDPVEDLVYLRPSIEPVFSWDRFLERYAEAGGQPPQDPRVERFYAVWQEVWRCAQCVRIGAEFDQGDHRLPSAIAGCLLSSRFRGAAMKAAHGSPVPVGI